MMGRKRGEEGKRRMSRNLGQGGGRGRVTRGSREVKGREEEGDKGSCRHEGHREGKEARRNVGEGSIR